MEPHLVLHRGLRERAGQQRERRAPVSRADQGPWPADDHASRHAALFQLISEAAQLVLHAAAQDRADRIYVLQMCEQVRLLDLARNLIRLSGFVTGGDIQIVYSGIRPGEKLQEELVGMGQVAEPSTVEGILQVQAAQDAGTESVSMFAVG